MKKLYAFLFSIMLTIPIFTFAAANPNNILDVNNKALENILKAKGVYDATEKTFKVSIPRDDLNVSINGIKLPSAMGLTSWVAFKKINDKDSELSGSLVLTEDQIDPVMQAVIDNNLNVVELHNHLLWESPKLMFMHIQGIGDAKTLALEVNKVFDKIKESSNGNGEFPIGDVDTSIATFDKPALEKILGAKGEVKDGVYRITIDKAAQSIPSDDTPYTGRVNIAATFAGSEEMAVLDGDFALQEPNLQKVVTALHKGGITIVAINQRMVNDKTTFTFLHYWAIGKPADLARNLRNALDISQELPPKKQLAEAEKVVPTTPLAAVAPDLAEHIPYVHVRIYMKYDKLPLLGKAFKVKATHIPKPVEETASYRWNLGKPSEMVHKLWERLAASATTQEIITKYEMLPAPIAIHSITEINSHQAIEAGKPVPENTNVKTLNWSGGKPSEWTRKLWSDLDSRLSQPQTNIIPKAAVDLMTQTGTQLAASISKLYEWMQMLSIPDKNQSQATIQLATEQSMTLYSGIPKPSEWVHTLWGDLDTRQAQSPQPSMLPQLAMALATQVATQAVTEATAQLSANFSQLSNWVHQVRFNSNKNQFTAEKSLILYSGMTKPSEWVHSLWNDLDTRQTQSPQPNMLPQLAMALATQTGAQLSTNFSKLSNWLHQVWFKLNKNQFAATQWSALSVSFNKFSYWAHTFLRDSGAAAPQQPVQPTTQIVAPAWFAWLHQITAEQSLRLYSSMTKPSEWVHTLWSSLDTSQLPPEPQINVVARSVMKFTPINIKQSFSLYKKIHTSWRLRNKLLFEVSDNQSVTLYGNMPKPSEWVQTLWSDIGVGQSQSNVMPELATQFTNPVVAEWSGLSASINKLAVWVNQPWFNHDERQTLAFNGNMHKPSEWVHTLWSDLDARQSQPETIQTATVLSASLSKISVWMDNLWQNVTMPQQSVQPVEKKPNALLGLITRGIDEHIAQAELQAHLPQRKITTASEFVHGLWHVFDDEEPATQAHVSILMRNRALPKFVSTSLERPSKDNRRVN